MIYNPTDLPITYRPGSIVTTARLLEPASGTVNVIRPEDAADSTDRGAASDPMGVGDVHAHEIAAALQEGIEAYLTEFPEDRDSYRISRAIPEVVKGQEEHERVRVTRLRSLEALTVTPDARVDRQCCG